MGMLNQACLGGYRGKGNCTSRLAIDDDASEQVKTGRPLLKYDSGTLEKVVGFGTWGQGVVACLAKC